MTMTTNFIKLPSTECIFSEVLQYWKYLLSWCYMLLLRVLWYCIIL